MKTLFCRILLSLALWGAGVAPGAEPGPVVLDIGHQSTATGAKSPDGRVNEYDFWCRYAGEVKAEIEAAGYSCVVLNRGAAPADKTQAEACRAAGVEQLNKPDIGARRYPSTHYPQHIGCGMVSADRAIDLQARCVVFLHLNSTGSRWVRKAPPGLIICNRLLGNELAEAVCTTMKQGVPEFSQGIRVQPRFIGSQASAGWMNALDAAGIPAVVFEALYVNHRPHVDYICNDAQARRLARTIAAGVVAWLKQHPQEED